MTGYPSERMKGIEKTLIRQINDRADASCINLGLGELEFPTPAAILERVSAELKTWPMGYTPNPGLLELRTLIAERRGSGFTADNVCVTIGAEEALFALIMVLVGAGDEVLVPDPGFPAYATIVRLAGGIPVGYALSPENGFAVDIQDVEHRISPRTKVLVLNSPHNPTGAVCSPEALARLAEVGRRNGLVVLSDEVYREIVFEGRAGSPTDYYDRTVVVDSLSKTYSMTGWRLGWCVGPPEIIQLLGTFNQLAISCPPAVCQRAALLALRGIADEEKKRNIEELRKRRDLAARCLDRFTDLKYFRPQGAFYLWIDISARQSPSQTSFDAAVGLIDREKVVVIPGSAFGRTSEGYLRLSFAASPEKIEEGIRRIGRYFGRT